jgi:5'-nucleotidase / UDP-sugar diphosphatase
VNAIANGNIVIIDITGGVSLQIDTDGTAGPAAPRTLVNIKGLTASQLAPARDFVL